MGSAEFWKHYDAIYADKDYAAEVATILPLLNGAKTLLDIGCGTGNHAIEFSRYGLAVAGIDIDGGAIEIAAAKKSSVHFFKSKIKTFETDRIGFHRFQAATSLFNVVNYILGSAELGSFFEEIGYRLKPGAPFIFDCWNGEAALADPPRVKVTECGTLTPTIEGALVHMRLDAAVNGEEFTHEFDHRLWTIAELMLSLWMSGFAKIHVAPWMRPAETATAQDWKIMFVCRKT